MTIHDSLSAQGADRAARAANRAALEEAGFDLFPAAGYRPTHRIADLKDLFFVHADLEERDRPPVRIAGRLIGQRRVGGLWFGDLMEDHRRIQLRLARDRAPAALWTLVSHLDIGDILGAEGPLVRTNRQEITVAVSDLTMLCKPATTPPIGKLDADGVRHAAQADRGELLRSSRHVAFLTDEALTRNLRAYADVLKAIRAVLDAEGYLELNTSLLAPFYGGAAATPFITHLKNGTALYMRVSPEPDLKRALAGGLHRIYEIGRNGRNEGVDGSHQPTFLALEAYGAFLDYFDMMELTERIFIAAVEAVWGTRRIRVGEHVLDFDGPWPRMRLIDLVARFLGMHASDLKLEVLQREWDARHPDAPRPESWGELLVAFFEEHVEDSLVGPCFVTDHPVEVSPLTKKHRDDPRLTERFEVYVGGLELANSYSELNDPIEQRARLEEQDLVRDEPYGVDEYFLSAVDDGLPQAGGLGIGLDRLVMVITGAERLDGVVPFPLAP